MLTPFTTRPIAGFGFIILSISLLFLVQGVARNERIAPDRGPVLLTGTESHTISHDEAAKIIANFRVSIPPGSVTSEMFGRGAIERILNQEGCAGLRISYARRDDGTPVLVLSGVDQDGTELPGGELAENGIICPPICGFESALTQ